MFISRCKIPTYKRKTLVKLFTSGATARGAARIVGVNRNTAALFFRKIRAVLAAQERGEAVGTVEVDETYLSSGKGGRKAARRGRNLAGKFCILGAVERGTRKTHLEEATSTRATKLESFCIRNAGRADCVHTDAFTGYKHLTDCGFKHYRVNHFITFKNRITGACTNLIESVWACLKRHFARFCGGWRHNLHLWLAEVEKRFEYAANFGAYVEDLLRDGRRKRLTKKRRPKCSTL